MNSALLLLSALTLQGDLHHVQGIDVRGKTLWVSSVDTRAKRGLLYRIDRRTGRTQQVAEIHSGARYHPGGISIQGGDLWVPVAEYRASSTTTIQRRNSKSLALEFEFAVDDHIGAIVAVPEGLLGANWDARELYLWTKQGKLLRKFPNPARLAIQDMKLAGGTIVAGGLEPDRTAAVVWLEWPSLSEVRRLHPGRTDRGVPFTNEGLAVHGDTVLLLPEDAPSRLFTFRLSQQNARVP